MCKSQSGKSPRSRASVKAGRKKTTQQVEKDGDAGPRATRSSNGIVQQKKFNNVVDWTRRSPAQANQGLKREHEEEGEEKGEEESAAEEHGEHQRQKEAGEEGDDQGVDEVGDSQEEGQEDQQEEEGEIVEAVETTTAKKSKRLKRMPIEEPSPSNAVSSNTENRSASPVNHSDAEENCDDVEQPQTQEETRDLDNMESQEHSAELEHVEAQEEGNNINPVEVKEENNDEGGLREETAMPQKVVPIQKRSMIREVLVREYQRVREAVQSFGHMLQAFQDGDDTVMAEVEEPITPVLPTQQDQIEGEIQSQGQIHEEIQNQEQEEEVKAEIIIEEEVTGEKVKEEEGESSVVESPPNVVSEEREEFEDSTTFNVRYCA